VLPAERRRENCEGGIRGAQAPKPFQNQYLFSREKSTLKMGTRCSFELPKFFGS